MLWFTNLRCCPENCTERLNGVAEGIRKVLVPADIRIGHLPSTSKKNYSFKPTCSVFVFELRLLDRNFKVLLFLSVTTCQVPRSRPTYEQVEGKIVPFHTMKAYSCDVAPLVLNLSTG